MRTTGNGYKIAGGLYKAHEKIGEGTFGEIFKGINERTQEHIAIKIVYLFST